MCWSVTSRLPIVDEPCFHRWLSQTSLQAATVYLIRFNKIHYKVIGWRVAESQSAGLCYTHPHTHRLNPLNVKFCEDCNHQNSSLTVVALHTRSSYERVQHILARSILFRNTVTGRACCFRDHVQYATRFWNPSSWFSSMT